MLKRFLLCLLIAPLHAAEEQGSIDVRLQQSSGDFGFTIGLPGEPAISRLDYELDGSLIELQVNLPVPELTGFSLEGRVAQSINLDGTSLDTDWDDAGNVSFFSKSDSDVDASLWQFDVQWARNLSEQMGVGAHIGYQYSRFDTETTNLRSIIFEGEPDSTRISGAVSTYDVEFESARIGVNLNGTGDRLSWLFRATLLPEVEASSEAFWILRNYPFWQDAEGEGLDVELRLDYRISDDWSILGGIRWVELDADEKGLESGVAEGVIPYFEEPVVQSIDADYTLIEFGARLRF